MTKLHSLPMRVRLEGVVDEHEARATENMSFDELCAERRLEVAIGERAAGGEIPVGLHVGGVGVGEVARVAAQRCW